MAIAGIVLAAGCSSRMQGENKLLLPWGLKCVLREVVENTCGAGLSEVVVVTGHGREATVEVLAGLAVREVNNPDYGAGIASSIVAGVEAAGETGDVGGYLFVLGDMPQVRVGTMELVCAALVDVRAITVPTTLGKRGNPVAIGAAYKGDLLALSGDRGARSLLQTYADSVVEVAVEDRGILLDVDTPESYRTALANR
jgi:molybdenum cofactor cytidylyltransferase